MEAVYEGSLPGNLSGCMQQTGSIVDFHDFEAKLEMVFSPDALD